MASLVSNNKCKIVTCTSMAWPNNYGYCKLHRQVDNQEEKNKLLSNNTIANNHECKAPNCTRRFLPNNYGYCEIHREYVSRRQKKYNIANRLGGIVNTGRDGHIEAETLNRLRKAVPAGEMPDEKLLDKLVKDPIISQLKDKVQILSYYKRRIYKEIRRRITVSMKEIIKHDIDDNDYINEEIKKLMKDPLLSKHCTEKYIRNYFIQNNIFSISNNNSDNTKGSNCNRGRYNPLPYEQHLIQVQHLLSLCMNGHDVDGASNCTSTYLKMLSSDLITKRNKTILPYNVVKAAYEIAYHKQDSNLIVQFLRTVLENGNSSTCFYYANIQIELLKFLLSYNLNQAVSTVSYHILNTIIINILVL